MNLLAMSNNPVDQSITTIADDERSPLTKLGHWLDMRLRGATWIVTWVLVFNLLCAVYLPALKGPFVYDDYQGIVTNSDLRHPDEPWRVLRKHETSLEFDRRPVSALLTMLDYQTWGLNAFGYRITNLVLHFICGMATASLLVMISIHFGCPFPRAFGNLVALLWLFHPLTTSAVSFIYQRSEVLMSLFYLLSLLSLLRAHESRRSRFWLCSSLLCAFLAALSKEPGLTLVAALPLLDRVCLCSSWSAMWKERGLFYVVLFLGIIDITAWISTGVRMGELNQFDSSLSHPLEYFKCQCQVVARYLKLVIWPHPLIFVSVPRGGEGFSRWFIPFIFLTLSAVTLIHLGFRKRWIWLSLGGFLILLAPTSSFVPIPLEPEAEFRMYLPSMFVLGGLVAAIGQGMLNKRLGVVWVVGIFLVPIVAGAVGSAKRNHTYSSALELWIDSVRKAPQSGRAWLSLGMAAVQSGNFKLARQCAQQLNYIGRNQGLEEYVVAGARVAASIELDDGDPQTALSMFEEAARADPGSPGVYLGLASAFEKLGRHQQALQVLERYYPLPLEADPSVALLYHDVYHALGDSYRAASALGHLQKIVPGFKLEQARNFRLTK